MIEPRRPDIAFLNGGWFAATVRTDDRRLAALCRPQRHALVIDLCIAAGCPINLC